MKNRQIKIGECYQIPLADGRNAYGHYIYWDESYGPLSRIFDCVTKENLSLHQISGRGLLFPPVFIGFGSVFRNGNWRVIGSLPIGEITFPQFRSSFGLKPGIYHDWKIYDGKQMIPVGDLPVKYRSLEFLCGWSPQALEERILSGTDRFADIL